MDTNATIFLCCLYIACTDCKLWLYVMNQSVALALSKASGLGLCWKQAVKMVLCFSVRTVLPRWERPLPDPLPPGWWWPALGEPLNNIIISWGSKLFDLIDKKIFWKIDPIMVRVMLPKIISFLRFRKVSSRGLPPVLQTWKAWQHLDERWWWWVIFYERDIIWKRPPNHWFRNDHLN